MNTLKSKIVTILVVIVVAAAAYGIGSGKLFSSQEVTAADSLYDEDVVTSIYNAASQAVVEVNVTQTSTSFFGQSTEEGLGSGFVIDSDGYIVTNNHVVEGASSVEVTFADGSTADAEVMGTDSVHDLAAIKVDDSDVDGITPLTLDDSDDVELGEMAIAIGNPYGYQNTITVGVISGLDRTISDEDSSLTGMLQTDAALNPGNSGGPLLNADGAVIGVNTAIESSATGIGFAVPSNIVEKELDTLEEGTDYVRPWLGISGRTLTEDLADELELSVDSGVYIVSVVDGSPADDAGLIGSTSSSNSEVGEGGDVITEVDGEEVTSITQLSAYIADQTVGQTVTLEIVRDGETQTVDVELAERPSTTSTTTTPDQSQQSPSYPWGGGNNNFPFPNSGGKY